MKILILILKKLLLWYDEKIIILKHKNKRLKFLLSVDNDSKKFSAQVRQFIIKNKTAGGYIPFSREQTEIIVYNFFSVNYGFRSKMKILISYTNEKFEPLYTNIFELEHRGIFILPTNIPTLTTEPVFCVVLLGHDQMRANHGGLGGHLRFWGEWNNFAAFTHSMPIPISPGMRFYRLGPKRLNLADRRIYPEQSRVVEHYGFKDGKTTILQRGDLSDNLNLNYGYSVMGSIDNRIFSCFHNSPYSRQLINQQKNSVEHVVAIPPFEDIEIYFYFGECCTVGSTFSVSLHTESSFLNKTPNSRIIQEKVIKITSLEAIKLSSIFINVSEIGKNPSWLIFKSVNGNHRPYYINLIYGNIRTLEVFDGVHSHSFAPSNKFGVARSLKFAPFNIGNCKAFDGKLSVAFKSILVIWGDNINSVDFRLRIFSKSDTNFEQVHALKIGNRELKFINLNDYITLDTIQDSNLFLAQIESEQQNLNANLYCLQIMDDKSLIALAVDHLTGG